MISNILSTDKLTVVKSVGTHASVTEAHSAWFSFAKEKEVAIFLDEGRADAISPAADFTGVLRFWKDKINKNILFGLTWSPLHGSSELGLKDWL